MLLKKITCNNRKRNNTIKTNAVSNQINKSNFRFKKTLVKISFVNVFIQKNTFTANFAIKAIKRLNFFLKILCHAIELSYLCI